MRDLDEDLKICEEATPGPWTPNNDARYEDHLVWGSKGPGYGAVAEVRFDHPRKPRRYDAKFIAEAREGWPHAIKRALEAEEEVDQLKHEMRMLQDELNRGRRV